MPYNYGNFQNGGYSGQMYYNSSIPGMTWNQSQPQQYQYNQPASYQGQMQQQNQQAAQMQQPVNYNTQQMPQMQQPVSYHGVPQGQQIDNGFVWVQGEAGMKAYLVAAGRSVVLRDSDNQDILCIKTTDPNGKPLPIEMFARVYGDNSVSQTNKMPMQATPVKPAIDLSEYVKNEDLEAKVMELIDKALGK